MTTIDNSIKDKILELIQTKPKHYSLLIKRNEELLKWVNRNSLIQSEHFPDMIYSAIKNESNVCINGNIKKISRINEGWTMCGPAATCKCTRNSISSSVILVKSLVTKEQQDETNLAREQTMEKKFGVKFSLQRPEVRTKLSLPKIKPEVHSLLSDISWLTEEYINKKRTLVDIADELGIFYGTVGEYCKKFGFTIRQRTNYSLEETKVCKFLESLNIDYIHSDWKTLGKKEIDILVPDKKFGIEINGLYWHSYNPNCSHTKSEFEDKRKHIDKTELSRAAGIELMHITDYEWKYKEEIIQSIIKTRFGLSERIYARNCEIKEVSKENEKLFLNKNHLQGSISSQHASGLYYNNELVMIMTSGKSRTSKVADIELLRLCTKIGFSVVGGAQKLFKDMKTLYSGKKIVSYCDLSKFSGSVYEKLGFEKIGDPTLGFFWTDGTSVLSRHKSTHDSMAKWLKGYDENKSQTDNMFDAGYRRYWDAGQATWILDLTKDTK